MGIIKCIEQENFEMSVSIRGEMKIVKPLFLANLEALYETLKNVSQNQNLFWHIKAQKEEKFFSLL